MIHLIYDTETNGLPIDYKAHVHKVDNWPRVVQLAWMLVDDSDWRTLTARNRIIKPGFDVLNNCNEWEIPADCAELHGITTERAINEGDDIRIALVEFAVAQNIADVQVGHNVNFDRKNVGAEFIRADMEDAYEFAKNMQRYCTMFKSTKLCGLRNKRGGLKWPTLQELHFTLFLDEFGGAHDALADVMATRLCYRELLARGVV